MPKTKIGEKYSPKPPPIDWLWAAVLERKKVLRYDLKQMAEIAGVTYATMRRYIGISPWQWNDSARNNVCRRFGIKTVRRVEGAPWEEDES